MSRRNNSVSVFVRVSAIARVVLTIGLMLLLSVSAQAEQPLNDKIINSWLSSLDALEAWSKKHEEAFSKLEENDQDNGMSPESMIAELKAAGLYSDAAALLRKYGFKSPEDWADVQVRIMKAVMSLQMEAEAQHTDMQAEIEKIRKNSDIPAEYKEQMIAMMESSKKMLEEMSNAAPEDKAAVKPHLDKIISRLEQMDVEGDDAPLQGHGIPRE